MDPYYYRRYYSPYYNYQQNIVDSQIANVDQNITNYGSMTDVIQNSDIYQSMAVAPVAENIGICTEPPVVPAPEEDLPVITEFEPRGNLSWDLE